MKRGIEHLQNEADPAGDLEKEDELSIKRPRLSAEENQFSPENPPPPGFNEYLAVKAHRFKEILELEAYNGNIAKIEELIETHSVTMPKDKNLFAVILSCAVKAGQISTFDHVVKKYEIKPNYRFEDTRHTVLHIAALYGQIAAFDHFINQYQLDPHSVDYDGRTPLHYAARGGQITMIDHLVDEHGLDPRAEYDENLNEFMDEEEVGVRTALNIAAFHAQIETFDHLVKKYQLKPKDMVEEQNNLLMLAAQHDNIGVIYHLVKYHGFDPKEKNAQGKTALHVACEYGQSDCVLYLIKKHGLDPYEQDANGKTALHYAIEGRHEVDTLLRNYAFNLRKIVPTLEIAEIDSSIINPLKDTITFFDLIKENQYQPLKSFLESKEKWFIKSIITYLDDGENPLIFPLKMGNIDLTTLLVSKGASLDNIEIEQAPEDAVSSQTCLLHAIIRAQRMGVLMSHQNPLVELDDALLKSLSEGCQSAGPYQDLDKQILAELLMSRHVICQDYVSLESLQVQKGSAPIEAHFQSNTLMLAIQYLWHNFEYNQEKYAENLPYIQKLGEMLGGFSQGMEGFFTTLKHPMEVIFAVIDKLVKENKQQAQDNELLTIQNEELTRINKEQAQLIEKLMQKNSAESSIKILTTQLETCLHPADAINQKWEEDEYDGIRARDSWMPAYQKGSPIEPCVPIGKETQDSAPKKQKLA